ncbi:MAG: hypothetical protein JO300_13545 [Silvibacterium sp.]|nr:hypothetical protein [Silvibacterium sp.]
MGFRTPLILAGSIFGTSALAQQQPIAYVPVEGVSVSGSLAVANGKASIGNDGTVRAGDSTAHVQLARGGELRLCASTEVHLSRDSSLNATDPAADSALMIALDRGAIEASYKPGKYSDVLLTPDLRILVSGPGQADLKVRTNQKGDTCVDNHGANAPYITVTSQFEGGLYRVQPNQRVMFEHGSLDQVVDNEPEPCGCPVATPPVSIANAAPGILPNTASTATTTAPAKPAQPTGGPSSTPADTAFPLAESEGLKPPPPAPTQPVVPAGTPHAEVQVPITYDAKVTPDPAAPGAAGPPPPTPNDLRTMCAGDPTKFPPGTLVECAKISTSGADIPTQPPQVEAQIQPSQLKPAKNGGGGFFHAIGRFFSHLFGRP